MLECSRNDKKALTNTTVECLKVFKWHIKRKRRQKEEMAHQRGNEKKGKTMHVRSGCVQGHTGSRNQILSNHATCLKGRIKQKCRLGLENDFCHKKQGHCIKQVT
eukprot:1159261-Pelagomonas_calceolata.AAC.12